MASYFLTWTEGVTAAAKGMGQNFSVTQPWPVTVDPLPTLLTASHAPLHVHPPLPPSPLCPGSCFQHIPRRLCWATPRWAHSSPKPQGGFLLQCSPKVSVVMPRTLQQWSEVLWVPDTFSSAHGVLSTQIQAREGGCRAVGDPQLHSSSVQPRRHSWMLSCRSPRSCCTWPFSVGFSFYVSVWFRIALWIWYLASACAWFLLAICLTWAVSVQVLLNTLMLQNSKKRVLLSKLPFQAPHTLGAQALGGVWYLWFPLLPVALGRFGCLYNAAPDKALTMAAAPVLGWAAHLVCSHSCNHWGHLCLHAFQGASPGVPAPEVLSCWEEAALEVWLW